MDVQLASPGLKIDVAERLEIADLQIREFYKHTPVACEPLKVNVALSIEVRAHLLDLEIGHVADALA